EFEMGAEPNYEWGASSNAIPPTTDFTAEIDNTVVRNDLIKLEDNWKYFDQGKYPGANWTSLELDDSKWESGQAMLGYGNSGSLNIEVSFGPDSRNRYPTTYFRKTFVVTNADDISRLEAKIIRDDGAVVYLNGHEIIRTNMPDGKVDYDTYANVT